MNPSQASLVLAAVLGLAVRPVMAAEPLTIAVPWAEGSSAMTDLRAAGREVARRTEGGIRLRFVEQPAPSADASAWDGALLAGPCLLRYSEAARVYAMPLFFRSAAEAAAHRPRMERRIAADLEAQGFASVALLDLGFAYLHGRRPLHTVERFRAGRLWAPAGAGEMHNLARELGVTAVALETDAVREALREGAVDVVLTAPLAAIVLRWHTAFAYVADTPVMHLAGAVVLRDGVLDGWDEAAKETLRETLARAFAAAAGDLRKREAEALEVLAESGVERHPLGRTAEERAEWAAWAEAAADRLAAGEFFPAELLDEVRAERDRLRAAP